jgi:DNA-binding GntR family transcriptional regulator
MANPEEQAARAGEPPTDAPSPNVQLATVSTVQAAANALREQILDGHIEPGARLRENEFAERLGIARHSFRAAAQILIAEGLLRREPNRGVHVPVFDPDDLIDVFRLRIALEVEAVRLVMATGEVPDAAEASVRELSGVGDDAPWRAVVEPDMRFHQAIIDATGSQRLARAYSSVQSEILLCLVQLRPYYHRPAEVAAEHEELIAAIRAGDAQHAEELFRVHLAEAADNLTKAWQEQTGEKVIV